MNRIKKYIFHKNVRIRAAISTLYILAGIIVNFFLLQVYCMPVWWAAICFILCSIASIWFPFLRNKFLVAVASFLLGVAVLVFTYCHLFLWGVPHSLWSLFTSVFGSLLGYLLGILVFGGGLLAFIPLYFLYHIYKYYRSGNVNKRSFRAGLLLPLLPLCIYCYGFKNSFEQFKSAYMAYPKPHLNLSKFKPDFYTERVLGIGIKYHILLEFIYDGWRPPMHDPFLNISIWFYSLKGYPLIGLSDQVKYYQLLFPDKPVLVWCPCSYSYDGLGYFRQPPTSD